MEEPTLDDWTSVNQELGLTSGFIAGIAISAIWTMVHLVSGGTITRASGTSDVAFVVVGAAMFAIVCALMLAALLTVTAWMLWRGSTIHVATWVHPTVAALATLAVMSNMPTLATVGSLALALLSALVSALVVATKMRFWPGRGMMVG